ncbi:MAG: hypothetical protein JSS27_20030 [Planctomycetes bacterium]|nr:hypothetical protein [Planctomycetota bacterium]
MSCLRCYCALAALVCAMGLVANARADEPAAGRDIYVNHVSGDDRNTGLAAETNGKEGPVKTIHHGVRRAKPGDTVHLIVHPTIPYRESVVFHNAHGEPGRPITFDGHGATIEGSDPITVADWQEVSPGLYRNDHLLSERLLGKDGAVIQRWFFRIDGKMNFMGRTSKGKRAPLKAPAELQPGEWTFEQDAHAFYIKTSPGKKLADYRIEAPLRSTSVQMSGDCSHLLIRNLTATHVYNDGYNIHGKCRDVRFENIAAIECGDDGMSAHDDCQIAVDGFVTLSNSTGLCDVGDSVSHYNRVYADSNIGFDVFFLGSNEHSMKNSAIRCCAQQSLVVQGEPNSDKQCTVRLDNVLVDACGKSSPVRFGARSVVEADHVSIRRLDVKADGTAFTLKNSEFISGLSAATLTIGDKTKWAAENNVYDLEKLIFAGKTYAWTQFAEYQAASQQDRASNIGVLELAPVSMRGLRGGLPTHPATRDQK